MFTGIIKKTGLVNKLIKSNNGLDIYINSKIKLSNRDIGNSICCSGVCLTLTKIRNNLYKFYVSKETLKVSNFSSLKIGDLINLENSLKFGDKISGHLVQGHVDTKAIVKNVSFIGKSWFIDFTIPKNFKKYLIYKGSVAVNGVSLTVSKVFKSSFQVVIIPHTLKLTNLMYLKVKDFVNIEFDIIGKYINKFENEKN